MLIVYGISLGTGTWDFVPGQWTKIRIELTVNTFTGSKANADGIATVYINDGTSPVFEANDIKYRTMSSVLPAGNFIYNF